MCWSALLLGAAPGRVSSKMNTHPPSLPKKKKQEEEVKNEHIRCKQRHAMLKRLDLCDLPLSPFAGVLLGMTSAARVTYFRQSDPP